MKNIFIANITIKAKTPLKVASGQKDFLQDSPIQKDWNDLPMILGTSLAGVLRKEFDDNLANDLFGNDNPNDENGKASRFIISNALLLDENQRVSENLLLEKSDFLKEFEILVKREHTAINGKGVAKVEENAKFDEEVLYAGSKFKFFISLLSDNPNKDQEDFFNILDLLSSKHFRIGGGSTKGFGEIEVEKIDYDIFNMASKDFVNFENTLNTNKLKKPHNINKENSDKYDIYEITLKPDDFFMFGSGFGDGEADMTAVYEKEVNHSYDGFSKKKVLIPASSVKGAISHRTTFHYNQLNDRFIGSDKKAFEVVEPIFGAKKDKKGEVGFKGRIIMSDVYVEEYKEKVFDHVAIDRFTGGSIEGALFQEKTINTQKKIKLEILLRSDLFEKLEKDNLSEEERILLEKEKEEFNRAKKAFENALGDLTSGMLSLGGATTKGHGIFTGEWKNVSK